MWRWYIKLFGKGQLDISWTGFYTCLKIRHQHLQCFKRPDASNVLKNIKYITCQKKCVFPFPDRLGMGASKGLREALQNASPLRDSQILVPKVPGRFSAELGVESCHRISMWMSYALNIPNIFVSCIHNEQWVDISLQLVLNILIKFNHKCILYL